MADLIAKTPLAGKSGATHGGVTLAEVALGQITSVAPFNSIVKALKSMRLTFPAPNTVSTAQGVKLVWTGRNQAFLIGADATPLAPHAALTDQSDGWACLSVTGLGAAEVLMRLIPLDLNAMLPDGAARSQLGHMQVIVMRGQDGFDLLVFRSMAATAWHEVETAMKRLAARTALHADQ